MNPRRETISWFTLERYALGELPEPERIAVEGALPTDAAALECLARIQADVRTLPPLPVPQGEAVRVRSWWFLLNWRMTAALATVAALVLWMRSPGPTSAPFGSSLSDGRASIKGDAIAISLIRERSGSVAWDSTIFTGDDRFKLRVTCGAAHDLFANVVVHQDGEASFPLEAQGIACGNGVVLRGAFRLTGWQPARICVLMSDTDPASTQQLRLIEPSAPNTACLTVNPAR